jgi:hypothetical protein
LVFDKYVPHNAVDVLDRIVSHQVVRPRNEVIREMKKTTRLALPLIFIGAIILVARHHSSAAPPNGWWPDVFAGYYLFTGLFLWSHPSTLSQRLAILAWAPLVFGRPLGAIRAMKTLQSTDPNYLPPRPTSPPREAGNQEGRFRLICQALKGAFGVDFTICSRESSFRKYHAIPPGHVLELLDELNRDYCFLISAADGDRVDSLKDLLDLLELRHPYQSEAFGQLPRNRIMPAIDLRHFDEANPLLALQDDDVKLAAHIIHRRVSHLLRTSPWASEWLSAHTQTLDMVDDAWEAAYEVRGTLDIETRQSLCNKLNEACPDMNDNARHYGEGGFAVMYAIVCIEECIELGSGVRSNAPVAIWSCLEQLSSLGSTVIDSDCAPHTATALGELEWVFHLVDQIKARKTPPDIWAEILPMLKSWPPKT